MNAVTTAVPAAGRRRRVTNPGVRADIEGLRAVAVGTVLLYHAGLSFVPGGFAGVDIFFVISGYLITSLLLREAATKERISITGFYARRARRLLPAASLVLVFTAVAGWAVLPASRYADLSTDVVAATLYVVNWALAHRAVDYLAEGAGVSPVQHYWSLSVEEQYYVVWPLLIMLCLLLARRRPARARTLMLATVAAVFATSLAWSVIHTPESPATSYFTSTTRVWELAVGSLLAFGTAALARTSAIVARALTVVGLLMIAGTVVVVHSTVLWPGWAALVPTLGTAAVIAGGCHPQVAARPGPLGWRPLVWLGGISYSLYLWHWPLIVLADEQWPDHGRALTVVVVLVAVALAWLTKRLLEDPVRFNSRLASSRPLTLAVGAVAMALTIVVGLAVGRAAPTLDTGAAVEGATVLVADPGSDSWRLVKDPSAHYDQSGPLTPDPAVATEDRPPYYDKGCQVGTGKVEAAADCVYGADRSGKTMVMLGDSKMGQWFSAVRAIADAEDWRLELDLKSACTFSFDGVDPDCATFTHHMIDNFRRDGAPDYALVSQGSKVEPGLEPGMKQALGELAALGTKIVLVADNPTPNSKAVYECVEAHPDDYAACSMPRAGDPQGVGTPALAATAKSLDLPMVDLNDWICPPGDRCPAAIGGTLLHRQGSHLTDSYIRSLTPMLYRSLSELGIARRPVSEIGIDQVPASRVSG
ncbi:acyltransferase family protein [Nocardioides sp. URHA0020]|uniref:acyltransferase family protein n=1 Tax=Nocardioides sp. URHA0020 TaxID=1380392 RepID=UPI000685D9B8|nr:acyltransferase family protein [Nocardioides sp. URHA0020]